MRILPDPFQLSFKQSEDLETDASFGAVGAALLQGKQPVCYHCDLALGWFSEAVLNSSTYDKALYSPIQ